MNRNQDMLRASLRTSVLRAAALLLACLLLATAAQSQSAPQCSVACNGCSAAYTDCYDTIYPTTCHDYGTYLSGAQDPCSTACTWDAPGAMGCHVGSNCEQTTCVAYWLENPSATCGTGSGNTWAFEPMEFFHQDALGSVRLVTTFTTSANSYTVSRHDYLPFGEEIPTGAYGRTAELGYSGGDATRHRFTGKERDTESNLDYFGARYYSGAQGRFTSADEPFADQDPGDPQSWNLYSYVRNQPLNLVDPSGRQSMGADFAYSRASEEYKQVDAKFIKIVAGSLWNLFAGPANSATSLSFAYGNFVTSPRWLGVPQMKAPQLPLWEPADASEWVGKAVFDSELVLATSVLGGGPAGSMGAAGRGEDILILGRGPLSRLESLARRHVGRVSTTPSAVPRTIFRQNYRDIRSADRIFQYMDNIPTTLDEALAIGGQYSRAEVCMINQRKGLLEKTIRLYENAPAGR